MSVATLARNGFHAAVDYLATGDSAEVVRLSRRRDRNDTIDQLKAERLTLQEDYNARKLNKARRDSADAIHAATCAGLQEQLKGTVDPAERAAIRDKISEANIVLDAACRQCDAFERSGAGGGKDQIRLGEVGAEIHQLKAELARRPLANPALFAQHLIVSHRVTWLQNRSNAAAAWVERVQAHIKSVMYRFERSNYGETDFISNRPAARPDVSALEEQLADWQAEHVAAREELAAAQVELAELYQKMVDE